MTEVSDSVWYLSEIKDRQKVMRDLMQRAYSHDAVLTRLRKLADLDAKLRIAAANIERNPDRALRRIEALRAAFDRL